MPPLVAVELEPHDECWATAAKIERGRLLAAISSLQEVHHIGSTAIPGIAAKPVLDLLGVTLNLPDLDRQRPLMESLGYVWRGEYGLVGRRYCTLTDRVTGARRVQLHCYAQGDPSVARHLAFRNYLRAQPELAAAYEEEKMRCARLNSYDARAYSECKGYWIRRIEAKALRTS